MNGRILIKNAVFFGYHGDLPEERALGQRFLVDVALTVDFTAAAQSDRLDATVNYVLVHDLCRQVMERENFNLLETLIDRLATRILEMDTKIQRVELAIRKPAVPIQGAVDYVAVELTKTREDSVPRARQ